MLTDNACSSPVPPDCPACRVGLAVLALLTACGLSPPFLSSAVGSRCLLPCMQPPLSSHAAMHADSLSSPACKTRSERALLCLLQPNTQQDRSTGSGALSAERNLLTTGHGPRSTLSSSTHCASTALPAG